MKEKLNKFIEDLEINELSYKEFTVKSKLCNKKKHAHNYFGFTKFKALLTYISEVIELTEHKYVFDQDINMMLEKGCVECMELLLEELSE